MSTLTRKFATIALTGAVAVTAFAPAAEAVVTVTSARPSSRSSGPWAWSTVWMRDMGAIRRSRDHQPVWV